MAEYITMKDRVKRAWLFCRYEIYVFTGKAGEYRKVVWKDNQYLLLYSRLLRSFRNYQPNHRDYISDRLPEGLQLSDQDKAEAVAQWAAKAVFAIELMHKGVLPPNALEPMVEAVNLDYYYEQVQKYKKWLFSPDYRDRVRSLPFFYMLASEHLHRVLKDQMVQMEADTARQSQQLPTWISCLAELWPPARGKRLILQYLKTLIPQKPIWDPV